MHRIFLFGMIRRKERKRDIYEREIGKSGIFYDHTSVAFGGNGDWLDISRATFSGDKHCNCLHFIGSFDSAVYKRTCLWDYGIAHCDMCI